MAHLEYGVTTGKGFVLLTGEVGTGKTTLIHSFLDRHRHEMISAFVFSTAMNFVELLRLIHEDFDTGVSGDSEAFLLIELNRFLLKEYREGRCTALFLDEAQNLSVELLEKIRMLSNLEARKSKLIQIVLVGQPELARKLERPDLRQLKQRVAVRFDIPPMTEERTIRYVEHRLSVVRAPDRGIFTDEALHQVHIHSQGIPRLVNVICSNALLLCLGAGKSRVDEETIGEVIADLSRGVPPPAPPVGRESFDKGDLLLRAAVPAPGVSVPLDHPLTAIEAARYLRVSTKTARALLRSGAIPASKVGRSWRVLRCDLDDFVRRGGKTPLQENRDRPTSLPRGRRSTLSHDLAGAIESVWSEARSVHPAAPEGE
jgi:general secretion pathway protein A